MNRHRSCSQTLQKSPSAHLWHLAFRQCWEPRNSIACSDVPQNRRSYIIPCVPHLPQYCSRLHYLPDTERSVCPLCASTTVSVALFFESLTVTISALSQDQECNFATGLHVWTGARRSSVLSHTILLLHRPYLHDLPSQHKILISRRRDFSSL